MSMPLTTVEEKKKIPDSTRMEALNRAVMPETPGPGGRGIPVSGATEKRGGVWNVAQGQDEWMDDG